MGFKNTVLPAVVIMFFLFSTAFANKASVEIQAPETAAMGTKIKIKIKVTHDGNNFLHYTNFVYLKINGKEVARWKFAWNKRPEKEEFTREYEHTVDGPVEIEAKGNCNLHGSKGSITAAVAVK